MLIPLLPVESGLAEFGVKGEVGGRGKRTEVSLGGGL